MKKYRIVDTKRKFNPFEIQSKESGSFSTIPGCWYPTREEAESELERLKPIWNLSAAKK